jgi:hypothetical protein
MRCSASLVQFETRNEPVGRKRVLLSRSRTTAARGYDSRWRPEPVIDQRIAEQILNTEFTQTERYRFDAFTIWLQCQQDLMCRARDRSTATPKLSGDVIGFTRIMVAMRQFLVQDAIGLHYAVRIFVGTTFVWLALVSWVMSKIWAASPEIEKIPCVHRAPRDE